MAWHGDKNIPDTVEALFELSRSMQIIGKSGAGKIADVLRIFGDFLQLCRIPTPEANRATSTRELQRKGGAPRAGPDNSNRSVRPLLARLGN